MQQALSLGLSFLAPLNNKREKVGKTPLTWNDKWFQEAFNLAKNYAYEDMEFKNGTALNFTFPDMDE